MEKQKRRQRSNEEPKRQEEEEARFEHDPMHSISLSRNDCVFVIGLLKTYNFNFYVIVNSTHLCLQK